MAQVAAETPVLARQSVPVDEVYFILHDGNNFCFEEVSSKKSASVLINFETRAGAGELLVRRSGTEVDYSLSNPITHVDRWIEAGVTKTQFSLQGRSGGHKYEGKLTVLHRAGVGDGIVLTMSRDGKSLKYDCSSDLTEEEQKK